MQRDSPAQIGAYLLGRMAERDRDEFEARLLEEPHLLAAVRRAEADILNASFFSKPSIAGLGARWFVAGAVSGAALTGMLLLLFDQ
jgi:hypothetical protein